MIVMILVALVTVAVGCTAFVGDDFRRNAAVIKQYRFTHFVANVPVLLAVVLATVVLLQVPYFDKNPILWFLSLITGEASAAVSGSASTEGQGGANLILWGVQWKLYGLIFLPILFFALPTLAWREERDFREGTIDWPDAVVRSIKFGLAHLIMLIPIGMALALSIAGLWYTYNYFAGGVKESTLYHASCNSIVVGALFAALLFS